MRLWGESDGEWWNRGTSPYGVGRLIQPGRLHRWPFLEGPLEVISKSVPVKILQLRSQHCDCTLDSGRLAALPHSTETAVPLTDSLLDHRGDGPEPRRPAVLKI